MSPEEAEQSVIVHDRYEKYLEMFDAWQILGGEPEEFPLFDPSKNPSDYINVEIAE